MPQQCCPAALAADVTGLTGGMLTAWHVSAAASPYQAVHARTTVLTFTTLKSFLLSCTYKVIFFFSLFPCTCFWGSAHTLLLYWQRLVGSCLHVCRLAAFMIWGMLHKCGGSWVNRCVPTKRADTAPRLPKTLTQIMVQNQK